MEKPKPDDDEPIEPVVNDAPSLFELIDWMFFAGTPIQEPELEEVDEE